MKYLPLLLVLFSFCRITDAVNAQGCPMPYAKPSYTTATDGFTVSFTTQSCDPDLVYSWDFGDGAFSGYDENRKEISHIYGSDGVYMATMRAKNRCEEVYPQAMTVPIKAGQPATMALTLTGPTVVAECQQLSYQAHIRGGVPPYTYAWKFDQHYCSDCSGTRCGFAQDTTFASNTASTVHLRLAGAGLSTLSVTITDGHQRTVTQDLKVQVKAPLTSLGIKTSAAQSPQGIFSTQSDILFEPDVSSLFTLDYPTSYFWNFGDGEVHDDRYDGGGVWVHQYAQPGSYLVTLSVCDSNGCIETTKRLQVADADKVTGPQLKVVGQPNVATWLMAYNARTGRPSAATVEMVGADDCASGAAYEWTATLSPELGLSDPVLFSRRRELCSLTLGQSMYFDLSATAPAKCWNDFVNNNHKPWGFIGLNCTKTCADSSGSTSVSNDRLVYIRPDELEIDQYTVSGSCRDYIVSWVIKGGAWKKTGEEYGYKQITWQAFDTYDHEKELTDIFIDVPGESNKKKINLDHPYFKKFGINSYFEFTARVKVQDYANGSIESSSLIIFNPFQVALADHYKRCPGVPSQFSPYPIADGGSQDLYYEREQEQYTHTPDTLSSSNLYLMSSVGRVRPLSYYEQKQEPYTYNWSPDTLRGSNPTFMSPAAGDSAIYSVTVTDRKGCSLSRTTTVTTEPLALNLLPTRSVCTPGARLIRPGDIVPTGGSGIYTYKWSPEKYLSTADSLNPALVGLPAGQSATYVLTMQDVLSSCTISDTTVVTGVPNDLQVSIADLPPICYGTATELHASATSVSSEPGSYQYHWETTHWYHHVDAEAGAALPISAAMSTYPGSYEYKVRCTNLMNGCYAGANKTVVVRDSWKHTGYVADVKSAIAGAPVELWGGGKSNHLLSAGIINKNNLQVLWTPTNPISKVFEKGTSFPVNGKFIPSATTPYLTMQITDKVTGCVQQYSSQRYVVADEKPTIRVTADARTEEDAAGAVCFDVYLDAHISYETSLLPTAIDLAYQARADLSGSIHTGSMHLLLENSSGLYHGQICTDFPNSPAVPYSRYFFDVSALKTSFWEIVPTTYEVYLTPSSVQAVTVYPLVSGDGESGTSKQNTTLEVFPNPFSDQVAIRYTLPADCAGEVALYILDFTGRPIKTIERRTSVPSGDYQTVFDGSALAPGIYFYELVVCNGLQAVKKVEKVRY